MSDVELLPKYESNSAAFTSDASRAIVLIELGEPIEAIKLTGLNVSGELSKSNDSNELIFLQDEAIWKMKRRANRSFLLLHLPADLKKNSGTEFEFAEL